jgi:hypothetical protein
MDEIKLKQLFCSCFCTDEIKLKQFAVVFANEHGANFAICRVSCAKSKRVLQPDFWF